MHSEKKKDFFYIVSKKNNACLEVLGGLNKNGTRVVCKEFVKDKECQHFFILPVLEDMHWSNGFNYIINRKSGLALDLSLGSRVNGASVVGWEKKKDSDSQKWKIRFIEDGFFIFINLKSGTVLHGNNKVVGWKSIPRHPRQLWRLVPIDKIDQYKPLSLSSSTLSLDSVTENYHEFEQIDGKFKYCSCGSVDSIYATTDKSIVNFRNRNQWIKRPGKLSQVSVGKDGEVWGVNIYKKVYRWGSKRKWEKVKGELVYICVGDKNNVWGINEHKAVVSYNPEKGKWLERSPKGKILFKQVCCNANGTVYGLCEKNKVYKWEEKRFNELRDSNNLSFLNLDQEDNLRGICSKTGTIFQLIEGGWIDISGNFPNKVNNFSCGMDCWVCIDAEGKIYIREIDYESDEELDEGEDESEWVYIMNKRGLTMLDFRFDSTDQMYTVECWKQNKKRKKQLWKLIEIPSFKRPDKKYEKTVVIFNKATEGAVTLLNGKGTNRNPIVMSEYKKGDKSQMWFIVKFDEGFIQFVNVSTLTALDLASGLNYDGQKVVNYKAKMDTPNQKWKIFQKNTELDL